MLKVVPLFKIFLQHFLCILIQFFYNENLGRIIVSSGFSAAKNSNKRSSIYKIFSRFSIFENFVMPPVREVQTRVKTNRSRTNIQNEELTRYRLFLYTREGGYIKESY